MSAKVFTVGLHDDAGALTRTFRLPFHKLDGTAAPGIGDDDADGFVAGSMWADRTNDKAYICVDNATGAAVWIEAGASASGTVTSIDVSGGTTGLTFSGGPVTTSGTITLAGTLAIANGGSGATTAAGARTAFGGTTVGQSYFTLTNPSAITFPRMNADNTVTALSASAFRTAIGAGAGDGDVSFSGAAPTAGNVAIYTDGSGNLIEDGGTLGTAAFSNTGDFDAAGSAAARVSDTAYSGAWNAVTTIAPSKNAVFDYLNTLGTAAFTASSAYQPIDATLTALAAADWVANAIPIGSGADTLSQVTFAANTFPARAAAGNLVAKTITDFGLSLVDDADAATGRVTLGGTTVGQAHFTLANPSAIRFVRINADNSVDALSASDFRTAIGAGVGGGDALVANPLSQFAATTSAQLAGVISDETGTGLLVFGTGPSFTTTIDVGTAGGTTGAVNLKGTTSGTVTMSVAAAAGTHTIKLPTADGTANQILKTDGSGQWGWVTSTSGFANPMTTLGDMIYENATPEPARLAGNITASRMALVQTGNGSISAAPTWGPIDGAALINGTITVTVAASECTIAVKNFAGTDPSATNPVHCTMANADGTFTTLAITAALSVVMPSGATMGAYSSMAFRVRIVLFNDSGTARLGVVNCIKSAGGSGGQVSYLALRDGIHSSTAIDAASDNAKVIYGTAVTSKPMRIIGYAEWSSGLAAAGTWSATPTTIVLQTFGVALPGSVVQTEIISDSVVSKGTTTVPGDDTRPLNNEGSLFLSATITPQSAASIIDVRAEMMFSTAAVSNTIMFLVRDSGDALQCSAFKTGTADDFYKNSLTCSDTYNTASATTFKIRAGTTSTAYTINGWAVSSRWYGGYVYSSMTLTEICG